MKKSSQNQPADATAPAVPERVSVAMAEIAENMQEGLLALAVGAGLQVMQALMETDVAALAGRKGRHDRVRIAVRHGRERGSVTLGGRRVPITRPRVRATDGSGELPIASYEMFTSTEILGRMAMEAHGSTLIQSPIRITARAATEVVAASRRRSRRPGLSR